MASVRHRRARLLAAIAPSLLAAATVLPSGGSGEPERSAAVAAITAATAPTSAGWGWARLDQSCGVIGGHVVLTVSPTPPSGPASVGPRGVVPVDGGPALSLPKAPLGLDPLLVSWEPNGDVATEVQMSDLLSASGKDQAIPDLGTIGTDVDGTPWAIYSTFSGTDLQGGQQVSYPISAFRLDRPGRAWQADALLGAASPVDPNVMAEVFTPSAIVGHVVIGEISGPETGRDLVALRLSDGGVAWRRPIGALNWQVADGALFIDSPDHQPGFQTSTTQIDDPDTGTVRGSFTFYRYDARIVGFPDKDRWVLSQNSGHLVIVDGRGAVVGRRNMVKRDPSTDPLSADQGSGIVVVHFGDGHYEGIDTSNAKTVWTRGRGLVRNRAANFPGIDVGDGYVSARTKSGAVALDVRTGKQVWTGVLTAAAPLGEVVNGRLLTCEGAADSSSDVGSAALSIPVKAAPLGLFHDTPIFPKQRRSSLAG